MKVKRNEGFLNRIPNDMMYGAWVLVNKNMNQGLGCVDLKGDNCGVI